MHKKRHLHLCRLEMPLFCSLVSFFSSAQEVFNNDVFRLRFRHAERSEFQQLLVIDPSDRRLVDDCRIHMFCLDLRNRSDLGVIHDDRIALDMGVAFVFADCLRMEDLGELPFPTEREIICAEEPLPFIHTSISDSAFWSPSVIRRSSTNSLEFASITTFVVRIVESTPLICTVSSVKTEFSPISIFVTGFRIRCPVPFPSP